MKVKDIKWVPVAQIKATFKQSPEQFFTLEIPA